MEDIAEWSYQLGDVVWNHLERPETSNFEQKHDADLTRKLVFPMVEARIREQVDASIGGFYSRGSEASPYCRSRTHG